MRICFFAFIFLLGCIFSCGVKPKTMMAEPVTAKTDERAELMSIVARLAGYPEYNSNQYADYVRAIEKHFGPYKDHPAVLRMRELGNANHIGYDAVMAMAARLGSPPDLAPTLPFDYSVPENRWKDAATCWEFVILLKQFYKDAACEKFFKNQKQRYSYAEKAFENVSDKFDRNWFAAYYGMPAEEKFQVIVALGNGDHAYGPHIAYPDGTREVFAFMSPWNFDSQGRPFFPEAMCNTLVHEFNHSWCNVLVENNYKEMEFAAGTMFKRMERSGIPQYDSPLIILCESMVRAASIRYALNHGDSLSARNCVLNDAGIGFIWMPKLVGLLGEYEKHRDLYPTMADFMPQVVAFFNELPSKIPQVASIEPFENGAEDVDPGLTEITVNFDKSLVGKGYSFNWGNSSQEHFPMTEFGGYSNDNKTITVKVALKPDFEYHLVLLGLSFKTPEGYPIEDYPITFKTRK